MSTQTEGLVQLDPKHILADDNSRYGLKKSRIEELANSIVEMGGVMVPVEVEPLEKADNGKLYRLTTGFYRHAAVTELNDGQSAGLTLPAIIKPVNDSVVRLRRQLSENKDRENQSPMDQAIAIKKLMDAGVSKVEIRRVFSRPGGRKGNQLQPASNAFINMTLSFLELPKAIQQKIHEGAVGVAAAYQLTKLPPEKRQAVLDKAENDRMAAFELEEKEEERMLAAEKKAEEQRAKQDKAEKELEEARKKVFDSSTLAAQTAEQEADALKALRGAAKGKDKTKAEEHFKAAQATARAAEKKAEEAKKALAAIESKAEKLAKMAAGRAEKLKKLREAEAKKGKVSAEDVKKAAKETGAESGAVALNASQMRAVVNDMALPGSFPKVQSIGKAFKDCFEGVITDRQLYNALAIITGEKKLKPKK